ncbi:MAG: energy-coupling factor transporter ATPase [Deltaproteobacteria bacterium]|nr:energy-coupling factor transporter ATPase [Deltaproteobacteria bacterium]
MIQINSLFYAYDPDDGPVLKDLNLTIRPGRYVGIIGPNGSGKTTLTRHLNGLLTPTSGDVWVEGINTKQTDQLHRIRQSIGMVFQNPDDQIVGMSVEEDVSFGPGNMGLAPSEIRKRVRTALERVSMAGKATKPPHTLSNGEKQRVAIAGILAMEPRTIVLDEPTTYLDPAARKQVLTLIRQLNQQGITIIHVTHTMDDITEADEIVVMDQGKIILHGNPADVFSRIQQLETLGLDFPQITLLMMRLNGMGLPVPTDIFSVDDACTALSALMRHHHG